MPLVSQAQRKWAHSPSGLRALGGKAAVAEWESETPSHLPERIHPVANFIKKAVKHPGALTAAAAQHGVSKREEAEKESHSSNPHIRSRGILGKRFMKGGDLHR